VRQAVFVTAKSKKTVVTLDNGSPQGARLWAYDAQGQVIWFDD
jgi:hypothetical protein